MLKQPERPGLEERCRGEAAVIEFPLIQCGMVAQAGPTGPLRDTVLTRHDVPRPEHGDRQPVVQPGRVATGRLRLDLLPGVRITGTPETINTDRTPDPAGRGAIRDLTGSPAASTGGGVVFNS